MNVALSHKLCVSALLQSQETLCMSISLHKHNCGHTSDLLCPGVASAWSPGHLKLHEGLLQTCAKNVKYEYFIVPWVRNPLTFLYWNAIIMKQHKQEMFTTVACLGRRQEACQVLAAAGEIFLIKNL